MTDEEKTAFETLTQSFTKMETLYKIKRNEVAIKKAKITRLTKQRDEYKQRAEKAESTLLEICNEIAKIVKQDWGGRTMNRLTGRNENGDAIINMDGVKWEE